MQTIRLLKTTPPVSDHINPAIVFVDVQVDFKKDGSIIPKKIYWEDDAYEITRLVSVERTLVNDYISALVFTCIINGKRAHLCYDEKNRFFLVKK